MAVTKDRPAPYAPTTAIMSVVERNRSGRLPTIVDADVLERSGISASLIPRTLQALQTLDLIGEDGRKTDAFEAIRTAPEADYKTRLAHWLTEAYADVLLYLDPATASEIDVRDAFRTYVPHGQQDRMVSLFMGLFTAAGVMPERQRQSAPRMRIIEANKPRLASRPPLKVRKPDPHGAGGGAGGGEGFKAPSGMPPAVAGLVQSLPAPGQGWTKQEREKFMTTFGAVLDFVFPIVTKGADPDSFDVLTENGD